MTIEAAFESWWSALPSEMKRDKRLALRTWTKLYREASRETILTACGDVERRWPTPAAMAAELVQAVRAQVEAEHFMGKDGQNYVPHSSTWLSKGKYDDAVVARGTRPTVQGWTRRLVDDRPN